MRHERVFPVYSSLGKVVNALRHDAHCGFGDVKERNDYEQHKQALQREMLG